MKKKAFKINIQQLDIFRVRQWLLVSALLHLSLGNLALVLCNYAFHPFPCTGSISLCLLYIKERQLHAMGRNTMLLFPLKNPSFQFSPFNSSLIPPKTYYLGKNHNTGLLS